MDTFTKFRSSLQRLLRFVTTAVKIVEKRLLWYTIEVNIQVMPSCATSIAAAPCPRPQSQLPMPPPSPRRKPIRRVRMASLDATNTSMPRPPQRRALLIGISKIRNQPVQRPPPRRIPRRTACNRDRLYPRPTEYSHIFSAGSTRPLEEDKMVFTDLKGPHKDIQMMKELLIDVYDFKTSEITTLIDNDVDGCIQPTKANILAQIDEFVKDARPGDKLYFHYSGHGDQQRTNDPREEDEMDEMIPSCDGQYILDDVLKERLVMPLPPKCQLIAVLDCCHSGSLLDLSHYRCNSVYVPWVNKGHRCTNTIQNIRTRMNGIWATGSIQEGSGWTYSSLDQIVASHSIDPLLYRVSSGPIASPVPKPFVRPPRRQEERLTDELVLTTSTDANVTVSAWVQVMEEGCLNIPRCSSPEATYCDGNCPLEVNDTLPDVICVSSAEDDDVAWCNVRKGESMTYHLCQILRKEKNPSFYNLMTSLSHALHKTYMNLHRAARAYRKWVSDVNVQRLEENLPFVDTDKPEMDNFLNPILSSHVPLDTRNRFWQP
ncbi:hypothetical protein CVT24_008265 [Panaeolus cyanescens]|uniref:Peptidase C14 caspase domain-containing protein n=1 Tax=Panaeolus cyanescens TaxID=181874 RepID=A0A409W0G4_9AGAR|nr:hypothetical protein CVT24_008265 [Panaeolus cyanescens]